MRRVSCHTAARVPRFLATQLENMPLRSPVSWVWHPLVLSFAMLPINVLLCRWVRDPTGTHDHAASAQRMCHAHKNQGRRSFGVQPVNVGEFQYFEVVSGCVWWRLCLLSIAILRASKDNVA